ncbi:dihydrolipoyl dehydrogenase [Candidatus Curtissbacteria bacterium]|nr:dihydrolipoyl dehydrogenase [Candidatus Curtissbacteria bacterium]
MKKFDLIVVGAGSGLDIVAEADEKGLKTALVEEGPLGGTCHNRGCVPSKMLIHHADVAETIRNSQKFFIKSKIEAIDFPAIVKGVNGQIDREAEEMAKALASSKNVTWYRQRSKFIGPKTMQSANETFSADKVIIVGGTRTHILPIPGLDKVKYITSTEALRLTKQPKHLVIVGGGYIACEIAHFYGALGTKITILVRRDKLLREEDEEISTWFTKEFSQKYNVLFNTEIESVSQNGKEITAILKGGKQKLIFDQLLLATGRIPNTDILNVKEGGIETDDKGYIKVNEYLETNVPGIWALGDIVGILPFKHTANHQAGYIINNLFYGKKEPVSYHAIAHAVFSSPQVAGVGKTEQDLKLEGAPYKVGRAEYSEVAMGDALKENGLVKVITDEKKQEIFGCHIVGPDASTLIHEVVVAMKTTGKTSAIKKSVFVHPALSEVVRNAFYAIE